MANTSTKHSHLDDELAELRSLLIEMSNLVDEQLADAINAVSNCDLVEAERVRARDDEVDAMELRIDDQCERIMALHTPVAVDLRFMITAVKVNNDLERIGDYAKNLAKKAKYFASCAHLIRETRIQEMADLARAILHEAQDSFIKRDRVAARQVLAHDLQVDRLHDETIDTIVRLCREHPNEIDSLVHLVTMSKGMERVADHAKNIAESVVFYVEGKDIRHRKLQRAGDEVE